MKRQTRSEQIQNAIDTTLSGLKDDPRLAQRVIRAARQMETPKRKRFYGMVLAALLLLLAATAVAAAYLSAQQFVQQEVLPLAQENDAHPRAVERAFVLAPLLDVAPDWRDPVSGRLGRELLKTAEALGNRAFPAHINLS